VLAPAAQLVASISDVLQELPGLAAAATAEEGMAAARRLEAAMDRWAGTQEEAEIEMESDSVPVGTLSAILAEDVPPLAGLAAAAETEEQQSTGAAAEEAKGIEDVEASLARLETAAGESESRAVSAPSGTAAEESATEESATEESATEENGAAAGPQDMQAVMAEADVDGDGSVDFDEFRAMMAVKVREAPSRPRSWANFSHFQLHSHMNAWADLHLFGPT
jgi:hypothetical protein